MHYLSLLLISLLRPVSSQTINGQFFSPGLVIVDAPASGNPTTVGATMPIALDISGDGLLPWPPAAGGVPTAILGLEIYLISNITGVNVTVAGEGSGLIQQEPGSTVKHISWEVPSCLEPGGYELTFYELDKIDDFNYYSIYSIPVSINAPGSSAATTPCNGSTTPLPTPQKDSRPPQQPFTQNGVAAYDLSTSSQLSGPAPTQGSGNGGTSVASAAYHTTLSIYSILGLPLVLLCL